MPEPIPLADALAELPVVRQMTGGAMPIDSDWIPVEPPVALSKASDPEWLRDEDDEPVNVPKLSPGMLLRLRDGDKTEDVLIGDANTLGGTCDCCNVGRDKLIIAYRRVWEPQP